MEVKKTITYERVAAWVATAGVFFMFWQSMRDIHKDMIDLRKDLYGMSERLCRLEVKLEDKK